MRPGDKKIHEAALRERLRRQAEGEHSKAEFVDISELAADLQGRLAAGPDVNLGELLATQSDEQLRGWRVAEIQPEAPFEAAASANRFSRVVRTGRVQNLVLLAPGEKPPEGVLATRELAELRRMKLDARKRARRIVSRLPQAVPVARTRR